MNKQTQAEKRMHNNDLPLVARLALLSEAVPVLTRAAVPTLTELVQRHELHAPHVHALVRHFIDIRHPQREFEQEVWMVVLDYLQGLDRAYATSLQTLESPQSATVYHAALLQRLENLALLALWHSLRYQPPPESYWRSLHAAYLTAESIGGAVATEAAARYLQVLALDSVDHGNLSRREIALVDEWLSQWCRKLELSKNDDGSAHQFMVDMQAPHGARYLRKHGMAADGRYWRMDEIVAKLQAMRGLIESGKLPPDFPRATTLPNALRLVDKLLLAWAPEVSQRERRKEERRSIDKQAQVVHGILNVCQHLKNTSFAVYPQAGQDSISMIPSGWQISNESGLGYGTLVQADTNRWLEPGCLIALNDDFNRGLTAIGIVRSIEQRTPQQYFAGVEVLSHTSSYVRLQRLTTDSPAAEAPLSFPAIFLPAADEPAQSSTLLLPLSDYETGAVYEMRTPQLAHLAQTGDVIEQQSDWIRVTVEIAADITL